MSRLIEKIYIESKSLENQLNSYFKDWGGVVIPPLKKLKSIEVSHQTFCNLKAEKDSHQYMAINVNKTETLWGVPLHIVRDEVLIARGYDTKDYFRPHYG
jgi:hypothetical protein